jgi:hypothetical protein
MAKTVDSAIYFASVATRLRHTRERRAKIE